MGLGSKLEWVVRGGLSEEETPEAMKASKTRSLTDFAGPISRVRKCSPWPT